MNKATKADASDGGDGGEGDGDGDGEAADYQRVNRELRRQRTILQHIIDTVPHSIFWKDRNSVYLGANKTKLRSLGLSSPEQLVGKTDFETRVSREQAEHYRRRDQQVLSTQEPLLNWEETQRHPEGERVLLTSKVLLRDEENELMGIAGICIDITERKRMEIELERARAAAEAAASARRDFLSAMSHEIRTPLTLILGPLDALLAGENSGLPEQTLADLARVRRNAGRLFTLANDILDFTRIEAGQMQVTWEPVDPLAVLSAILDDLRWMADQKRLQVRFTPEVGLGVISLDRTKFEKIAINLVTNALKYTPLDGQVEVSLRRKDGHLELAVADTGPGIPVDKQELIFQRFQPVDPTTRRDQQSAGFGLAFVRELVGLMGGTVGVISQVGEGSRFVVTVPLRSDWVLPVDKAPAGARGPAPAEPGGGAAGGQAPSRAVGGGLAVRAGGPGSRPSVVVAEDNADMRAYIRDTLGDLYDVQLAENGAQALELIRQRKPAVVVADIMMPEVNGYQLVATLKADPQLRQVPVIMVTAKASREEVVSGLETGADDYLTKPFGPAELRARVRAAERQSRTFDELAAKHRELSAAMKALNETQAELVQAEKMASLGTLVAGMSHELGNPVTAILMNAQSLLGQAPPDTKGRTSLEVIERQARRAGRLLKLLLDASQVKPIATAPVAVDALIARVAELAAIAQLRCQGVVLKVEPIAPGVPAVEASVEEMEVALLHVVKNALEAATPGGQVWIRATRRDDQRVRGVEILIGDSGPGIAQTILNQIFDPLFTTKEVGSGLGLGLTLARRIVESHHGTIRVESQLGVGTTVRIWLPSSLPAA